VEITRKIAHLSPLVSFSVQFILRAPRFLGFCSKNSLLKHYNSLALNKLVFKQILHSFCEGAILFLRLRAHVSLNNGGCYVTYICFASFDLKRLHCCRTQRERSIDDYMCPLVNFCVCIICHCLQVICLFNFH